MSMRIAVLYVSMTRSLGTLWIYIMHIHINTLHYTVMLPNPNKNQYIDS